MPLLGAHLSTGHGLATALERARAMGADCLQIFVGSPQTWAAPSFGPAALAAWWATRALVPGPVFVHAPYLVNLGSDREEVRRRSVRALVEQLHWAERLGGVGVVVHPGAGDGDVAGRVIAGLRAVLAQYPGPARLILENDAGQGRRIGRRFRELADLLHALDDPRLALCWDTCHAFAVGYDLRRPEGIAAVLEEIAGTVGLERLLLIHANDSKHPLGANRDRHENIGLGQIGEEGFRLLLQQPQLAHLPVILEVPGLAGEGPDVANLAALRFLARGGSGLRAFYQAYLTAPGARDGDDPAARAQGLTELPAGERVSLPAGPDLSGTRPLPGAAD